MTSVQYYDSPLGRIRMAADEIGLTGLWFEGSKYDADRLPNEYLEQETEILSEGKRWLDQYFCGQKPDFLPPLHTKGSAFQMTVWDILLKIPYGETISYGEIARQIAEKRGISRMSAQAVGGAVGRNPIAIIVPCHRVVGADGSLTGYAGGLDKKIKLLELEHGDSPLNLHYPYTNPTAIGGMSKAEINLELQKGMDSLKSGKVYTADEVEAEFAREFGIKYQGTRSMIRVLQKRDIDRVAEIWLECNRKAHAFISADYWMQNFDMVKAMLPQAEVYVYDHENSIQGFTGLRGDYIEGLFVSSECQSCGIGTLLLNHIKGIRTTLRLKVYQKNTRAIRFYLREGFEILSEGVDEATGEQEYVMIWQEQKIKEILGSKGGSI